MDPEDESDHMIDSEKSTAGAKKCFSQRFYSIFRKKPMLDKEKNEKEACINICDHCNGSSYL